MPSVSTEHESAEDRPPHALHSFMAQVTSEMGSEYQRIFSRAQEDPATAGDEGEENWATLFREWLPPGFHVQTKGRLIGHDGAASPQVDLVVLKPSYPKKLLEKKLWLAGGVAAAFECKTTLTAKHVKDSVGRCTAFKSVMPPSLGGSPRKELTSPLVYGILAHSHSWKAARSSPVENIQTALFEEESDISHPRDLIDLVCVAALGFWSRIYLARYDAEWQPGDRAAAFRKLFQSDWGVATAMVSSPAVQEGVYRPIGALLANITRRLAWDEPGGRDIADYYQRAGLGGTGGGDLRFWPPSVYSDKTAEKIAAGALRNRVLWDEWTVGET